MTEWFEQWFGEEYHALYPHRDDEDARRAVALIRRVVGWKTGDRVLDLACGPGRHAAELERLGARVVGFDLSRAMLRRARERAQTGGGGIAASRSPSTCSHHSDTFSMIASIASWFVRSRPRSRPAVTSCWTI